MVNIWSFFAQFAGAQCPLCHAPGDGLCDRCIAALPRNDHACGRCALPLPTASANGELCADCVRRLPAFDSVTAPLLYAWPVDELIGGFKFQHRLALGRHLSELLYLSVRDRQPFPDLLLPIPATPRRLRERGFNQAAELCRDLAQRLTLPWNARQLSRSGDSSTQRGLSRKQRLRNLRGSFRFDGPAPRHIALIDDVLTTGATADEASRVLRKAGVAQIEVWATARTGRAFAV